MTDESNEMVLLNAKGEAMAIPKPGEEEAELGVGNMLPAGSWTDWIGTTSGQQPGLTAADRSVIPVDKLVEMRQKDGQARALMRLFTLPIRSALKEAEWVMPEDTIGGEEETKFANLMWGLPPHMGGMSVPFERVISEALLAIVEGSAPFEEVRYVPKDGPLAGKICLKKLAYRDIRTIKYVIDDHGILLGVRQITTVNGKSIDVFIPKDKLWYYAANEEENPYWGISYFETAYAHHSMKQKLYYIAHIAAQFAAVPGRIGTVPAQASKREAEAFRKAIEEFAFNTSMLKKFGYEVDTFNGNTSFDFLKLIDHHNLQMAKSVLAKFLDDEQRQVLIENGKGDASSDYFIMALETIMRQIEQSLTSYVMPKFIDWNFGSELYPEFRFGVINDATRDVIADLLKIVATAQSSKWTDEFVRELEKKMTSRLGLDVDYEAVAKREEEQKAQEQQMIQAQFGGLSPEGGGGPPQGGPPQSPGAAPVQPPIINEAALTAESSGSMTIPLSRIAEEVAKIAARSKESDE